MNITDKLLEAMHIDYIPSNRNYWFVRTNGGLYFDEFYIDGYIGIEWDEISATDYENLDTLKLLVEEHYPSESRTGYIASQIDKFVKEFKKDDIIIIPNKNSKIFAIGELIDDEIYVANEEPREGLLFEDDFDNQPKFLIKRRRVRWLKTLRRYELDPRLQTFIYAHNTIVNLKPYATYIDRTLSDFYIKGEDAFFTFRVNKISKISLDEMTNLLIFNKDLCNFVNSYFPDEYHISSGEIISKIDVQSKGPVQLSGPAKKLLAIGLASTLICGGSVSFSKGEGFEISSQGIIGLFQAASDIYVNIKTVQNNEEYSELKKDYEQLVEDYTLCKEQLLLSTPETSTECISVTEQTFIEEVQP